MKTPPLGKWRLKTRKEMARTSPYLIQWSRKRSSGPPDLDPVAGPSGLVSLINNV